MKKWSAGSELDRVDDHRANSEWVSGQWEREDALLLKMDSAGRYGTDESTEHLHLVRPHGEYDPGHHFLLGQVDGIPVFTAEDTDLPEPAVTIREAAAKLSAVERDLVFTARAVLNWHATESFCTGCGGSLTVLRGGMQQQCTACGRDTWPRTDPAVIVAILNEDDEILLAHHVGWAEARVSVLAGFVEAGESLEQAVHREILEEVDIELAQLRYVASQPWPFPRSLMTGFVARARTRDITVEENEIGWADWYSRDRIRQEASTGTIVLPGRASLAHRLIRSWLEGRLSVQTCFPPNASATQDTSAAQNASAAQDTSAAQATSPSPTTRTPLTRG